MVAKESVRSLIEFVYRHGDIDSDAGAVVSMQEGIKIHQRIQSEYVDFKPEVKLSISIDYDDIVFELSGRVDGIKDLGDIIVIDEIKSTFLPLENADQEALKLHWYQAMIYGAIYSEQNGYRPVDVQLTYFILKDQTTHIFTRSFQHSELMEFLSDTLELYKKWAILSGKVMARAQSSAKLTSFPFTTFRSGQHQMSKAVYYSIRESEQAIIEAPTGIGKTMAALFPSVKSIGESQTDKVFYLTAKTAQRGVAVDAIKKLLFHGFEGMSIAIQAKEKMCINDVFTCRPTHCPYAKGHFDRVNDALFDWLQDYRLCEPNDIKEYCRERQLCPYEFALDISNFAQIIICDYNYVFDPFVKLKRYFLQKNNYTILIDEAHNLSDRARDMYSAPIYLAQFEKIIDEAAQYDNHYVECLEALELSLDQFIYQIKQGERSLYLPEHVESALIDCMSHFTDRGRYNGLIESDLLTQHYFALFRFYKLSEFYDERFYFLYDERDNYLEIRCLDASAILAESYRQNRSIIAFSATLSPLDFYRQTLGLTDAKRLQIGSPFAPENCHKLILYGYSTYSRDRQKTMPSIAKACLQIIADYPGNFLVFCPSYAYMDAIAEHFETLDDSCELVVQSRAMTESERAVFIDQFQAMMAKRIIGLVVTGGAFSEGIDLPNERLSGVIVIGVGMPTISIERDLMKAHYSDLGLPGFDYAYTYPGLNKVFQASGRLIRTETDRGVLALIDKRFYEPRYLQAFPSHWQDAEYRKFYK